MRTRTAGIAALTVLGLLLAPQPAAAVSITFSVDLELQDHAIHGEPTLGGASLVGESARLSWAVDAATVDQNGTTGLGFFHFTGNPWLTLTDRDGSGNPTRAVVSLAPTQSAFRMVQTDFFEALHDKVLLTRFEVGAAGGSTSIAFQAPEGSLFKGPGDSPDADAILPIPLTTGALSFAGGGFSIATTVGDWNFRTEHVPFDAQLGIRPSTFQGAVPEPGTSALLWLGLPVVLARRRKRA